MTFQVQAPRDRNAFAASAEPDVVRGEVGTPIKIRPLLNDLPGSDPNDPNAELVLGGKVPPQAGAKVVSDLDSGQLTFTGDTAGTYFLNYDAGYGNAPLDPGTIRVDVKPRPKRARPDRDARPPHRLRPGARHRRRARQRPGPGGWPARRPARGRRARTARSPSRSSTAAGCGSPRCQPEMHAEHPDLATRSATGPVRACRVRSSSPSGRPPRTTPRSPRPTGSSYAQVRCLRAGPRQRRLAGR